MKSLAWNQDQQLKLSPRILESFLTRNILSPSGKCLWQWDGKLSPIREGADTAKDDRKLDPFITG